MQNPKIEWASEWLKKDRVRSGKIFSSTNPANGKVLTQLSETTLAELDLQIMQANKAFHIWKKTSRKEKISALQKIGAIIREHHAELATLETLSNGKLYRESYQDDIPESADIFDYYAGWIDKLYSEVCPVDSNFLNYTVREPIGVCALFVPWNFPLLLACWKIAPALAMGNTIIVKPSPYTSLSLIRLCELIEEKGILPDGVLNVALGGIEVGEAISKHSQIHKISFTGSTQVGKQIASQASASNLKMLTLELGGKSPNIVFEDAPDIEFAMKRSFEAMFSHKGEKCSEPTRLIVHRSLYSNFVTRLSEMANNVRCGDPFEKNSDQGPQCHEEHFKKVLYYIELGKTEGARCVAGGERDSNPKLQSGYYIRPTIFSEVKNSMRIAQEEIFGPVLTIIPFETDAEAIEIANDSPYGLASGLWTSNLTRAHRVASELESGMVFINKYGCYDFASPFGGWKQSGQGKEMAQHSLDTYTRLKSIWVKVND